VPATQALPVSLVAMAHRQTLCQSVQLLRASTALALQPVHVQLLCDVAHGVPQPVVPMQDIHAVFQVFHDLTHPGIQATQRLF
jgi:cleavage and polyadenylation specificity factor subunit 1